MRIGKEERKTENQPQLPEHEARQDRTKKRDDEIEDASEDAPPVPRAIYHSIYVQSSQGAHLPALETRYPLQCKANPCFQPIFQSQEVKLLHSWAPLAHQSPSTLMDNCCSLVMRKMGASPSKISLPHPPLGN